MQHDLTELRDHLVAIIDRAIATGELSARERFGHRRLPVRPGDTAVRRELTGKHSLLITWEEPR